MTIWRDNHEPTHWIVTLWKHWFHIYWGNPWRRRFYVVKAQPWDVVDFGGHQEFRRVL